MVTDRGLTHPDRWTLLSLAVTTLVVILDLVTGSSTVLIGLFVVGPLLESVRSTPTRTAFVGAYALGLGILMGVPNKMFGTGDHLLRCAGVLAGGLLAVWAARMRYRVERRARADQERLRALIENSADGLLDEPTDAAVVVHYGDVTSSKESEESLREYARLLREAQQFNDELISGAGEGVIVYNRALRYAVWNRFMEELTGLKADRVLGQHPLDLFPHLKSEGVYALLERALSGETVRTEPVPYAIPATGRSGWVSGTYAPHRSAAGEIVGVIGLIRDEAWRKRAEEQLKSSEDRYRNIFHFAPIGIYDSKIDGTLLAANQALVRMLGYGSVEELLGKNLAEIYADAKDREAIIDRYEEGGLVRGVEVAWKRKDGSPIWVELHFHVKKDEQLRSRNTEGFVLDVTDRRRSGSVAPTVRQQLARSAHAYLHAR